MIHLRVQAPSLEVPPATIAWIENAFTHALDRFGHVVREVEITLLDVNGPKGGADKRCRVQMRLYPRGLLVVRSTGSSLFEAAREACDKARHVVAKRLSKQRTRPHDNPFNKIGEKALYGN